MDYSQNLLDNVYIFLISYHPIGKHVLHPRDVLTTTCEDPRWKTTIKEEFHPLQKNDTWDLFIIPSGRKIIKCIYVFKTKFYVDGYPLKYKERLLAKGFSHYNFGTLVLHL